MEEVLPGVHHWRATHPSIGIEVDSHHVDGSGTVIDPLIPADGIQWFNEHRPKRVVLSNRHHLRHAEQLAARFGIPILCHESGLHEFEDRLEVEGFAFGDRIADDVTALEMATICPDDTVLRIEAGVGALLFADSVIHYGELRFVPDRLIGDDPEGVKRDTRTRAARLAEDDEFDHLLFAHGAPLIGGGREALRRFGAG